MTSKPPEYKTLLIDNFRGSMSLNRFGDINSGKTYIQSVSGWNPFLAPGQLTWSSAPVQIDPTGSVITDLIMAGKERVESGILYVYAIGHTGRLYKIQVNNPATFNPDYDTPVLLATLSVNSPTFTRGGSIDFYGSTERIYIGHDMGVTQINFDGSGESFVGLLGSWTQNVPRPLKQFVGKLYAGNGSNIAEIDTTLTVTSYAKLSPGFPSNTQTRDMDLTSDGNYMEMIVTRLALPDVTSATQQTVSTANSESYIFQWNGIDPGSTASNTFPSFSLGANIMFQNYQYTFGTDQFGSAVFNPSEKILPLQEVPSVSPNAISSTGNFLLFMSPLHFNGVLEADLQWYGTYDFEDSSPGWWDVMFLNATPPETDIIQVPLMIPVSNLGLGSSSNGYLNATFGTSKIYFSTLETSSGPTTKYRFYKWNINTSLSQSVDTNTIVGVYETQTQMFSKKIMVKEVRIYGEPWVANNSFTIDLVGSASGEVPTPIPGGSKTFSIGSGLSIGNDFAYYNPAMSPTYALGVSITNAGSVNHTINKIEIDYTEGGK